MKPKHVCPKCGKWVTLSKNKRFKKHKDETGKTCIGYGSAA
jgi:hypothetical protein